MVQKLDTVDTPATGLDQEFDLVIYKTDSMVFRSLWLDTSYRGEYKVGGER